MPRDYRQFFAICKKNGWEYKDKVAEFTEGRTDSLSSLTDGEYKEMLLRAQRFNQLPKDSPADKMRKKIISMARQMGWTITPQPPKAGGKEKADMERIDNWCLKYGKFKKVLNKHTVPELTLLVAIFEEVFKTYLTGLQK